MTTQDRVDPRTSTGLAMETREGLLNVTELNEGLTMKNAEEGGRLGEGSLTS